MPEGPAIGRYRQENCYKFKTSLDYIIHSGHLGLHSENLSKINLKKNKNQTDWLVVFPSSHVFYMIHLERRVTVKL